MRGSDVATSILICCGYADGHVVRDSWDEADSFRWGYLDAGGHDRAAILRWDDAHEGFCNGYLSWAKPCHV